jgi:hypothetical protein
MCGEESLRCASRLNNVEGRLRPFQGRGVGGAGCPVVSSLALLDHRLMADIPSGWAAEIQRCLWPNRLIAPMASRQRVVGSGTASIERENVVVSLGSRIPKLSLSADCCTSSW